MLSITSSIVGWRVDAPLALAALKLKFDVVDGVGRTILARFLLLANELLAEGVVVRLFANLINDNLFLVVGNLVDDVFGSLAPCTKL